MFWCVIPTEFECISFPGPGVTNPMSENPFFEFMGAEGYSRAHQSQRTDEEFNQFKKKHERSYGRQSEEATRKTHFRHNYRSVGARGHVTLLLHCSAK